MNLDEAEAAVRDMLAGNAFGDAGSRVVIEEFLDGEEASFIVMVDGQNVLPMATSQDHKRVGDGDSGPNTGGMGAYSPAPVVTAEVHQRVLDEVIYPTVRGMAEEGNVYTGFLYAGLMIDKSGAPKVIEFNCRFGDPETQPIMVRLESSLVLLVEAALAKALDKVEATWDPRPTVGVVLAAGGYPGDYAKGEVIEGLAEAAALDGKVFHAGTALKDGQVVTSGGRVLCATAIGERVRRPATGLSPGREDPLERLLLPQGHRLPCHRPRARRVLTGPRPRAPHGASAAYAVPRPLGYNPAIHLRRDFAVVRLRIAIGLLVSFLLLLLGPMSPAVADDAGVSSVPLQTTATTPSANQNWRLLRRERATADRRRPPAQGAVPPAGQALLHLPRQPQAVWLQVQLPAQKVPSWLWICPRVQYLDYYLVQDGQLVRDQHTGESRPFQERPLPSRSYLFSLPVDGKPMTLYVRMTSNHPLMAWFDQIDEAGLVGLEKPAYAFGMLLGGMLLLLMYNLIRFAYSRSASSLWLAAVHAALAVCAAANLGLVAFWLPGLKFNQSLTADLGAPAPR